MTKYSETANAMYIKEMCNIDKSGIIEAVARLSVEHGMPVENISGYMFDLTNLLGAWSRSLNGINE